MINALIENIMVLVLFTMLMFMFTGIGFLVRRRIPAVFVSRSEILFFSFGIGMAITGYGVFALAAANLLYPGSLYCLTGLLLIIAAVGWRNPGIARSLGPSLRPSGYLEYGT